ncbi:CpaF family protein [Paracraurococcus lichenis]|uniref:CpaF family protein n=1 Tax=Paracraurococcus lichenis TaxID=3064888 RepID=A0ABT9DZ08_9PROT|nr:CpaF family protein [Paracraurococcus sp. LOR1-02]MDO9709137.1 CpaF family protein [Paracraurococcus sp. LOR1-02]
MSNALVPAFGRRRPDPAPSLAGPLVRQAPEAAPGATVAPAARPAAPGAPLAELRALCLARIDPATVASMSPERLAAEVERLLAEVATEQRLQLNAREQRQLALDLVDDMLGLGPLEPLLEDETITDIMVNGHDKVFIEQRGKVALSGIRFRDNQHLANICQRIAAAVGRRIDESSPMVDARLADGSRVNIVFPPLALDGPAMSIRKFAKRVIDFDKLVDFGALSRSMARLLQIAARCRLNVVISGGTGSGKTTMLNALSRMIDHGERIVTVEDAAELQLQQPHVVRLETRPPSLEGRGEITQRDLVRNALRMRPDRIILGECRGAEAFDMLQAMNTGHDGSMSTIHANTSRDALVRIENMVTMGNFGLPVRAIRTQIASAVDLIIQVERQRDGARRVVQVTELVGLEGDVFTLNDIFSLEHEGEDAEGRLRVRWKASRARPSFLPRLAYFGMERAWAQALEEAER